MTLAPTDSNGRLNIDQPRWLQDTYTGRAKHFFTVTWPGNLLTSNEQLEAAKTLVDAYRLGVEPTETTHDQIWEAKRLYDSAFHPDTGEKMVLIGRMSAQVPMNMAIMGAMMTFYRSTPAIIFWQWLNQSFNAIVNYTNRSGDQAIPTQTLLQAYVGATGGALTVGLSLKSLTRKMPPLAGRLVPFVAVASANCINIPLMRQSELINGVPVMDANGNRLGMSVIAARQAVGLTVISRVLSPAFHMIITPIIMNHLDKRSFMKKKPWLASPIQLCLIGVILSFSVPLCCAIFPQTSPVCLSSLEVDLQMTIGKENDKIHQVYFNKGL